MVSKRNIRLKKLKIQDSKFEFNQDKYKVIQKIHERKLNKFSKENAESNKRNRDASLEEMEDKLIKKRLSDLHFEEEKHAKLKKQLINKRKLINVLKDLKRPKELLHDENCNKFDSNIMWNSPSYIIRHIRNCILNHDWNQLTHLLLLLMNHQAKYFSYIKEVQIILHIFTIMK